MASLQDQFLKAGLVSQKEAKQASKNKRKKDKAQRKGQPQEEDRQKATLQQKVKAQADKDRQLNLQHKMEAEKKAIAAQIQQLVDMNKIDLEQNETDYSFTDGKSVKKLYAPEKIQIKLGKGFLAIVRDQKTYAIVTKAVAEKIAQRDESRIVVLHDSSNQAIDEDDPYADFKVPDDLMW